MYVYGHVQVHETRSHSHAPVEEDKVMTRKQKAENKAHESEQTPKKAKAESDNNNGNPNGKSSSQEFEDFCKAINEHLSVSQLREVLESNGLDSSGPDHVIIRKWSVHLH